VDGRSFMAAKDFLDSLETSLQVLNEPDSVQYLNGTYALKGSTVPELVDNMTAQGMKFAPATPGRESAYMALHSSFVSYARNAQSSTGFQADLPPVSPFKKAVN